MAAITKIVIFDDSLYRGNGDVAQWNKKITARFAREAKIANLQYHSRSGAMARGWRHRSTRIGKRQVQGSILNINEHASYVLFGTTGIGGFIYPRGGKTFRFTNPRTPGYFAKVRGQDDSWDDILGRAWRRTARDHSSIRGKGMIFG